MAKLRIIGGQPLHGEVMISGAKNAALPILCTTLLTAEPVILRNIPRLKDVETMIAVLQQLGVVAEWLAEDVLKLQTLEVTSHEAPYELVSTMRASILVLGPLLARIGRAKVSLPGGCAIGSRPVDQHLKGLKELGAQLEVEHGYVYGEAGATGLVGGSIRTDMVTVGGTEQFLMSAVLAKGTTILENAAREPEVVDLANILIAMGAKISGHGTDRIVIEGVEQLHGTDYAIISDRIEAGTFLCAVAATGGELLLRNVNPDTMGATLDKLSEAGLALEIGADTIHATMKQRPKAVSFRTAEHPGFPTDMQAQMMAMNCVAEGTAVIVENIFENRFMHVSELLRLNADILLDGPTAVVNGVEHLSGAMVMATDLRASASLVIAGLVAEGETIVDRIYHLDRGYVNMEQKLSAVGATIQRID
ncbi:UDP-N-acetylglucosamine 1-carboxyvinyltransferase [Oligella urethralis]|uniref:UDP-N-acetylglucosamine 1-carboxyvinyltransferase n=1 Tax=Oligella TaxID=90243 RepID=UPI0008A442DB|nr:MULTISPECIES: UDP-N-acetylglucosamine 1-carboxyvinyltransferase [Oligella]MDK6202558.1 UDP-N-acetylglucosamine 1-carboxyvinyltransferase [Oligella urethralis]OFV50446.1 UDP-N-acetylglucosamine 1-carboxyvinyltransferase [Oligella sp. HMSC09E12]WOS38490.1 UDP-N-acetylglucosamine 1-carboxyvinyltransferase [Oligella urethralis]SUA65646.1 UDP-N-acetylglucosamine 1-carboxyvinyltransferase [Oligella urethralis]